MKEDDLRTKLVMVAGFLALSYIFKIRTFSHIAMALAAIFLISGRLSAYVLWTWEKIALVLGWINSRILLGLVFYLVLFPIATLFKLFSKDPMAVNWKNKASTFTARDHRFVNTDLENPW